MLKVGHCAHGIVPIQVMRACAGVEIISDFVNEMVLSDHGPADYYVDAAIDYFGIEGEDGFVVICKKC